MTVGGLLRLWFGLSLPVNRRDYALSGFGLTAFKYTVEAYALHAVTGHWLTPLDYLSPLLTTRQAIAGPMDGLLFALALWTLPFVWIGVSMTLRRAEDAGYSPFLVLFFFMPFVNHLVMLCLCLLPSRPRPGVEPGTRPFPGGHPLRSALAGVAVGVVIAVCMVGVSVWLFGRYGTTLFVATPFVMGAAGAYVFNRPTARGGGETLLVAGLSVMAAGGAMLLFAFEGLVCLMMAAPPALVMAMMGGWLGRALALRPRPLSPAPGVAAMVLPLPLLIAAEAREPQTPPAEVLTVIEVAAPVDTVWRHVVTFSELDEPPAWFFRLGVAYPRRATIEGRGVGALRRCEFSTGAFLEPITVWDEPRRLAFGVAAQPPPLAEWSPYRGLAPPHLDGYLRVREGEFRLHPLPGGRTRLEGRTFYELHVFPSAYWSLWADGLIHAIHTRVLGHIKRLSEA